MLLRALNLKRLRMIAQALSTGLDSWYELEYFFVYKKKRLYVVLTQSSKLFAIKNSILRCFNAILQETIQKI